MLQMFVAQNVIIVAVICFRDRDVEFYCASFKIRLFF